MATKTRSKWTPKFVDKDNALHISPTPAPASGAWEWWYFDADFDNGYAVAGIYCLGSPQPPRNSDVRFIEISLYDPQGNKRLVRKRYPKEQCSASSDYCDVVIGPNFIRGHHPLYQLYLAEGNQGFDLTYQGQVEGYLPPEGLPIPDLTIPENLHAVGAPPEWSVPIDRAKVTGTLTWDGKTMNVTGEGYHDHNWEHRPSAGRSIRTMGEHFWGWLHIGEWTFNWTGSHMMRRYGYKGSGRLLCYKGEKLVAITYKGTGFSYDHTTEGTGHIAHPRTIKITYDEPGFVEGYINIDVYQVLECWDLLSRFKPFQRWFAQTFIGQPAYFRYRINYDAHLTVLGEKVVGRGKSRMENSKSE